MGLFSQRNKRINSKYLNTKTMEIKLSRAQDPKAGIFFMVWEADPSLRNKNKDLKMYVNKGVQLNIGDVISIRNNSQVESIYTIEEIISRTDGNLPGKDYMHVKANWRFEELSPWN